MLAPVIQPAHVGLGIRIGTHRPSVTLTGKDGRTFVWTIYREGDEAHIYMPDGETQRLLEGYEVEIKDFMASLETPVQAVIVHNWGRM